MTTLGGMGTTYHSGPPAPAHRATRPLPSGVYEIVQAYQFYIWIPCNFKYDDDQYNIWEVTVLPPEGTLHEAFFDPVESDGAIGASESIGVSRTPCR